MSKCGSCFLRWWTLAYRLALSPCFLYQLRKGAWLRRSFTLSTINSQPFQTTPMETPLTPLEFARRARKLYPDRAAVIDGDSRWTYAQFLDRCDRWSAALQNLGISPG